MNWQVNMEQSNELTDMIRRKMPKSFELSTKRWPWLTTTIPLSLILQGLAVYTCIYTEFPSELKALLGYFSLALFPLALGLEQMLMADKVLVPISWTVSYDPTSILKIYTIKSRYEELDVVTLDNLPKGFSKILQLIKRHYDFKELNMKSQRKALGIDNKLSPNKLLSDNQGGLSIVTKQSLTPSLGRRLLER